MGKPHVDSDIHDISHIWARDSFLIRSFVAKDQSAAERIETASESNGNFL